MSQKRTPIQLAVAHATESSNSANNAWSSLSSANANSNPHSNSTDFYTATNFNHTNNKGFSNQGMRAMRPGVGGFHGNVNILLGGAMLTVVTTIVCLICYCCHRKIKMRSSTSSLYRQQRWLDVNDANMEIYSVEQYFDTSGLYEGDNLPTMATLNEPPPSYECVMALDEVISRKRKNLYTFKGYHHHHHHHPGFVMKECMGDGHVTQTSTPQVSLDEANCDIRSPSSTASLCNCNCVINQNFTSNLCTNCNNVIDNADNDNNNNFSFSVTTISPTNDTSCSVASTIVQHDLSSGDELNNNDFNGNSTAIANTTHQSMASPSTSTSTTTNYVLCSIPLNVVERLQSLDEIEDDEDDDEEELDGNGNHRQHERIDLSTINRNGLIRLDMSQIIDQTGLPTYEAALHLKSSGYV